MEVGPTRSYKWKLCDPIYGTRKDLEDHMLDPLNVSEHVYICGVCESCGAGRYKAGCINVSQRTTMKYLIKKRWIKVSIAHLDWVVMVSMD